MNLLMRLSLLFMLSASDINYAGLFNLTFPSVIDSDRLYIKIILITAMVFGLIAGTLILLKLFSVVKRKLETYEETVFKPVRIGKFEILSARHLTLLAIYASRGIQILLFLGMLYGCMLGLLSLFPVMQYQNLYDILRTIFATILVTTIAFGVFKFISLLSELMITNITAWKGTLIQSVRFKKVELVSDEKIAQFLVVLTKLVRGVLTLIVLYLYVIIVFSFYGFTRNWSSLLLSYILRPLMTAGLSVVNFLPNFFTILVIGAITWYVIKVIRFIFVEVSRETISLPGFYPDWALPTYQITKILVLVFAFIVLFPYLPGSGSPGFRGISVFLGLLISLGSTSAIANIVAGMVITYMRPFKPGDRVKIADTVGDVVEKSLLVTRIRTVKHVTVTIPNAIILGTHIINYSSSARESGLILSTGVTIGYDVPWRQVHELLIAAARATGDTLDTPEPFVLQKSLDDFSVRYELNVATGSPEHMERIYSELHTRIQDAFNEAGVEIMSPQYSAIRDGNRTAIPPSYLPAGYRSPGFPVTGWPSPQAGNSGEPGHEGDA